MIGCCVLLGVDDLSLDFEVTKCDIVASETNFPASNLYREK